jgi:hypothetical protein
MRELGSGAMASTFANSGRGASDAQPDIVKAVNTSNKGKRCLRLNKCCGEDADISVSFMVPVTIGSFNSLPSFE